MIRINSIYAILFPTLLDFGINVSVADVRNEAFNDDGGCFSATFSNDTSHFLCNLVDGSKHIYSYTRSW